MGRVQLLCKAHHYIPTQSGDAGGVWKPFCLGWMSLNKCREDQHTYADPRLTAFACTLPGRSGVQGLVMALFSAPARNTCQK